MEIQRDFSELLASFNAQRVDYLIVGAWALALHGVPRYTGDLDLLVRREPDNARRVVAALDAFGFKALGLQAADFVKPDVVIQLGVPPVRIDLLTSITGVTWDEAAQGSEAGRLGEVPVRFLGRKQFVANKKAIGRPRDLADLEALGEA